MISNNKGNIKFALIGCGRIAKRHSKLLGHGQIEGFSEKYGRASRSAVRKISARIIGRAKSSLFRRKGFLRRRAEDTCSPKERSCRPATVGGHRCEDCSRDHFAQFVFPPVRPSRHHGRDLFGIACGGQGRVLATDVLKNAVGLQQQSKVSSLVLLGGIDPALSFLNHELDEFLDGAAVGGHGDGI